MGTTADITAEQHNETRRAAKQRQKHTPKGRARTSNDGYYAGLAGDRQQARQARNDQRRQQREGILLHEAESIIDQRLKVGSVAHEVAMLVIKAFPEARKTATLSRTKVAQADALTQVPSGAKYTETAVSKGMRVAGHAIWQAYDKLKG